MRDLPELIPVSIFCREEAEVLPVVNSSHGLHEGALRVVQGEIGGLNPLFEGLGKVLVELLADLGTEFERNVGVYKNYKFFFLFVLVSF